MRCFVALWPDDDVRQCLDAIAAEASQRLGAGRRIAAANLHLTLAFIGELASDRARDVAAELADGSFEALVWQLDHIGHFARAKVVWAGGPVSQPLLRLAAGVRTCLDRLGVGYDRKPFVPHVTLLRDAPHGETAAGPLENPLTWRVARPVLVTAEFAVGRPVYRPVA